MARSKPQVTAYDARRSILLVQILAGKGDVRAAVMELCSGWGVTPELKNDLYEDDPPMDLLATIRLLAKHAIDHTYDEAKR